MRLTTGRKIASIGALLAIFAFLMPWASCSSMSISGFDIARSSKELASYGVEGAEAGFLLWLVPIMALAILLIIYANSTKKTPEETNTFWQLICGLIGGGVAVLWLLGAITRKSIWIKIEYGIWLTLVGYIGIIVGTLWDREGEE